jgi:hypothetical protein
MENTNPTKPNWLGIASVITGLVVILLCIGMLVIRLPNGTDIITAIVNQEDALQTLLQVALILSCVLVPLGLVLAILAVFQKKQKRTWAVIGLVLNTILLCLPLSLLTMIAVFFWAAINFAE